MERPYILHMFTPALHMSPFDINMAADAGYQLVVPYGQVGLEAIAGLTQDTIFSRGPKGVARTGIFIGGRDVGLAVDMLAQSRAAMVKPFVVSVMADPSGAFTTAAAMVAGVEAALKARDAKGLSGTRVLVLGGTGPVGRIAGVLAAQAGAQVVLSSRKGLAEAEQIATQMGTRFGVTLHGAASSDGSALVEAEVLLACAAAGVQVVSSAELSSATRLQVAADLNAVPPAGIAGVGVMDNGQALNLGNQAVGFGALAVGNIKYQTQQRLLQQMRTAEKPVSLSFEQAFATAREIVAATAVASIAAVAAVAAGKDV
jgi:methylene-tetrahydromethanopterin dehydrogenase